MVPIDNLGNSFYLTELIDHINTMLNLPEGQRIAPDTPIEQIDHIIQTLKIELPETLNYVVVDDTRKVDLLSKLHHAAAQRKESQPAFDWPYPRRYSMKMSFSGALSNAIRAIQAMEKAIELMYPSEDNSEYTYAWNDDDYDRDRLVRIVEAIDEEDQPGMARFGLEEMKRILSIIEVDSSEFLPALGVLCIRDRGDLHSYYNQLEAEKEEAQDDG